MIEVSVIIVNYNTCKLTAECIESIYKQTTGISFEVIVVDNASTDGSAKLLTENFPQVTVIASPENLGFGGANNLGVKSAKGRFLFFLNPDTLLLNNAIKELHDFWMGHPELPVGVLGGMLVDTEGKENGSFSRFRTPMLEILAQYSISEAFKRYVRNKLKLLATQEYVDVDYVCGADMLMLKETFEMIGGFDTVYFMYYEESDMQKQLASKGLRSYIFKSPQILHYEGASMPSARVSNRKRMIVANSMMTFMKRFYSPLTFFCFKYLYIFTEYLKNFRHRYTKEEDNTFISMLLHM